MPILNYSTKIPARQTIGEIQDKLAELGAHGVTIQYGADRQPEHLHFVIIDEEKRYISFRLTANWQGILRIMTKDKKISRSLCNEEQAKNVAWRINKDWVIAQFAYIEAEQATVTQLFLAMAVNKNGATVFERLQESKMHLLDQ